MSIVTKRVLKASVAFLLLIAAVCVVPAVNGRTLEQRVTAWVAYHRNHLPARLDSINQFPVEYQRAIYAALPPADKAAVWREYLLRAADTRPQLTSTQRDFLRTFARTVTAEEFAPGRPYSPATTALMDRMESVMGQHASIIGAGAWRQTTPLNPFRGGVLATFGAARVRITEFLIAKSTASAQDYGDDDQNLPNCECWSDEGGKYNCPEKPGYKKSCPKTPSERPTCRVRYDAYSGPCSWTETRPCDGMCRYDVASGGPEWGPDEGEYESACVVDNMDNCPGRCDKGCWVY